MPFYFVAGMLLNISVSMIFSAAFLNLRRKSRNWILFGLLHAILSLSCAAFSWLFFALLFLPRNQTDGFVILLQLPIVFGFSILLSIGVFVALRFLRQKPGVTCRISG
jgi:hypothetical protein